MTIPAIYPLVNIDSLDLQDGTIVQASSFCKRGIRSKEECKQHYETLASSPEGFYECPFGFTSYRFNFEGMTLAITGVIGFPRFGSTKERLMGKTHPNTKVSRVAVKSICNFYRDVETLRADVIEKAAEILPQAFHELRKLNAAILQHAEQEINARGESRSLLLTLAPLKD